MLSKTTNLDKQCSETEQEEVRLNIPGKRIQVAEKHQYKSGRKISKPIKAKQAPEPNTAINTTNLLSRNEFITAYKWSQLNKFNVYPSKLQNLIIPKDKIDVTLVTQFSLDRLPVFEMLCERWAGPISAALYIPLDKMEYFNKYVKNSSILSTKQNIGCLIVKAEVYFIQLIT